ncbi:hypothetical protein SEA_SHAM4_39 [Mycobacterium phage Sham4]|nr:hypothetical protein SEA_JOSELITO_40 [Mycobacterium phage Joselito]QBI98213.1 hypothetical protein SEA_BOWTIE_40 [Mycobacterium phage Bowtie]QBI98410.1 hypothetical protein SEA_MUNCH_40 [Mycobacterium phage Munch]QBI98505.1 hypothetical protein SEA_BUD_39 [Mycobacterium phage Bud]QGZ16455.1 hypothetical protein SEA_ANEEM_40 [Mycobacterium phage Aneem]QPX61965.1 hypothetical protein SEA_FLAVERINT_40 [Mycobacterium phage Flaverint]UAW08911.1 hypothetical protein SEA_LUCIVIA_40 [Mycobacterium
MTDHHMPDVMVTPRAVYFDGRELPWYIAKDGISFTPGGHDDINRLTVEFLVGDVTFKDQWEIDHDAEWAWLRRSVWLESRVQLRALDHLIEEYCR